MIAGEPWCSQTVNRPGSRFRTHEKTLEIPTSRLLALKCRDASWRTTEKHCASNTSSLGERNIIYYYRYLTAWMVAGKAPPGGGPPASPLNLDLYQPHLSHSPTFSSVACIFSGIWLTCGGCAILHFVVSGASWGILERFRGIVEACGKVYLRRGGEYAFKSF